MEKDFKVATYLDRGRYAVEAGTKRGLGRQERWI